MPTSAYVSSLATEPTELAALAALAALAERARAGTRRRETEEGRRVVPRHERRTVIAGGGRGRDDVVGVFREKETPRFA